MKITIKTIPHDKQRYPTVGDWQFQSPTDLTIRVSEMGNPDYEFLVGIHEAIEAWLASRHGVNELDVDKFDMVYEEDRQPGDTSEPGDNPDCPVYHEHQLATLIERVLAVELNVDWKVYEKMVEGL